MMYLLRIHLFLALIWQVAPFQPSRFWSQYKNVYIQNGLTRTDLLAKTNLYEELGVSEDLMTNTPSLTSIIDYQDKEIDVKFVEAYRNVYNYTFDRASNPNNSITVCFSIDKIASIISNPSYLKKYRLSGIYALLNEDGGAVYIDCDENMISHVFTKLKEIQNLKKVLSNTNQQQRKLSFNNPVDSLLRELQFNEISNVKMEIFPNAKQDVLSKVTLYLVKKIKPFLNKALRDYGTEIAAIVKESASSTACTPSFSPAVVPMNSNDSKVSPFQENHPTSESISPNSIELILNRGNVDMVLNEVRPYLIADGGNVAVVSVNETSGAVELSLQGACGSCPSSTTTMKMGIERVLKEKFPGIRSVVAVNIEESGKRPLTEEIIMDLLGKLLPTIEKLGGKVQIESVEAASGFIRLRFQGSEKLQRGIELILRENNSAVKQIQFIDFFKCK